jgi:hypothetical protein
MLQLKKSMVSGQNGSVYELHELIFVEPKVNSQTFHRFNSTPNISVDYGQYQGRGFTVKCTLETIGEQTLPLLTWQIGHQECRGFGYLVGEHDDAIIKVTEQETLAVSINIKLPADFHQWISQLTSQKH